MRKCVNCGHQEWVHLDKEFLVEELHDAPYTCIEIVDNKTCMCRNLKVNKLSFKNTKSHKNETVEHFLTKSMVYKLLLENNRKASLERDSGSGVNDVFDWDNGTVYEVEPTIRADRLELKNTQYKEDAFVKEVIILPYKKIFADAGITPEQTKKLKEEIKKYLFI